MSCIQFLKDKHQFLKRFSRRSLSRRLVRILAHSDEIISVHALHERVQVYNVYIVRAHIEQLSLIDE